MQAITGFSQRLFMCAFALVMAVGVSGCSSETKERQAFITFLQTRIIDKPGVNIPRVTPEEEKSFGEYSKHFAVIHDFDRALESKVSAPMQELVKKGMPRTLPELVQRRADLATVRATASTLGGAVAAELAKADAQRAALKQPDDLKLVYDKAYARLVTGPGKLLQQFMPAMEKTMISAEKLAAYLEEHKSQVVFSGNSIQVNDEKVLAEANVLMTETKAHSDEVLEFQRKFNDMMTRK